MAISLLRRVFVGTGKSSNDWWYFTILPAIIAIFVIAMLMAIFLTPVAVENKTRLEERFRQNRQEAVEEYERDRREEGGVAAGVHRAATPGQTRSSSDPSEGR